MGGRKRDDRHCRSAERFVIHLAVAFYSAYLGEAFIKMPNTKVDELEPFVVSLNKCPKTGLHNPFKNVERYLLYGQVSHRMAEEMGKKEVCLDMISPVV